MPRRNERELVRERQQRVRDAVEGERRRDADGRRRRQLEDRLLINVIGDVRPRPILLDHIDHREFDVLMSEAVNLGLGLTIT